MKKIITIMLLPLFLIFTSCTIETTTENYKIDIRVLLDYTPNTNHTGIYVAEELGYYKDEGINISIDYGDNLNSLELVSLQNYDITFSYQEDITMINSQRDNESEDYRLISLATVLQENTSGFASLKDNNIKTAIDFENKTYGSRGTSIEEAILSTVSKSNGADPSKINMEITNSFDSLTMLQSKIADFTWIYYGWDGIAAETKGIELNFIPLTQLNKELNFYTPLIVSSMKTIKEKEDLMKRFIRATKKGYEYAAKNPQKAGNILIKHNPDLNKKMVMKSQQFLSDYLLNSNNEWGYMKQENWDNFSQWLYQNNIIKKIPNSNQLFTNEFLK